MSGDRPAPLADAIIDALKASERGGYVQLPEKSGFGFVLGDRVKLTTGVLMGMTGLYAGMRGSDRIIVLLSALGRVEVGKAAVERV
jgi:transcription antitermination factor NusG